MEREDHIFVEIICSSCAAHCICFYNEVSFTLCDICGCFSLGSIISRTDKYFIEAVTAHGQVKDFLIVVGVWSADRLQGSSINLEHLDTVADSQISSVVIITGN